MITGLVLVLTALLFTIKNILTEREAEEAADDTLDQLDQYLAALMDPTLPVATEPTLPPPATEPASDDPAATSAATTSEPAGSTASRHTGATVTTAVPSSDDVTEPSAETTTAATTTAPQLTVPVTDPTAIPDYVLYPGMSMPTVLLNGVRYLGILEIPALGLRLPVASECDMNKLNRAACRYWGSAYLDTMVIAAHNYAKYFGRLKTLVGGDGVFFTDMAGNVFYYRVSGSEILGPGDVVEMVTGDEWDLTLYTCTPGGMERLAVRCVRQGK